MKKKLLLTLGLCSVLAVSKVEAKNLKEYFPDDNFYACVIRNYNAKNGSALTTTVNIDENTVNLNTIENLNCGALHREEKIEDITGIEKFENLKTIDFDHNNISDASKLNELEGNSIESIDLGYNSIKELELSGFEHLTDLDISNNEMERLHLTNYVENITIIGNSFLNNIYLKVGQTYDVTKNLQFDDEGSTKKTKLTGIIEDSTVASFDSTTKKITALKEGTTNLKITLNEGTTQEGKYIDTDVTVSNTCQQPLTGAKRYEVTFETNGGNSIESIKKTLQLNADLKDEKIELPTPTKEGYRFLGWYTDKELKNKASIETYYDVSQLENINEEECSNDVITKLYAKWEISILDKLAIESKTLIDAIFPNSEVTVDSNYGLKVKVNYNNKEYTTLFKFSNGILVYQPSAKEEQLPIDSLIIDAIIETYAEINEYDLEKLDAWLESLENPTIEKHGIEFKKQEKTYKDDNVTEKMEVYTVFKMNLFNGLNMDNKTTSETEKNPNTGVKTFAIIDGAVIAVAGSAYLIMRKKNKYNKI